MPGPRPERQELAKKRLQSVLRNHAIATARTLEQKIADAGPLNQRIDPHVLMPARKELEDGEIIRSIQANGIEWYHLADADADVVTARLAEQSTVYEETIQRGFTRRLGQSAEIAVYRALKEQKEFSYFGSYTDLEEHDDSTL